MKSACKLACLYVLSVIYSQYFWYDDKGKKTKHTAPQYIDYVMTHIQKVINDESVFPTKFGMYVPV